MNTTNEYIVGTRRGAVRPPYPPKQLMLGKCWDVNMMRNMRCIPWQLIPDKATTALLNNYGSSGREILELLQTTMLVRNPTRRINVKDLLRYVRSENEKRKESSS